MAAEIRLQHVPFLGSQRWFLDGDLKPRGGVHLEKVMASKVFFPRALWECKHLGWFWFCVRLLTGHTILWLSEKVLESTMCDLQGTSLGVMCD